MVTIKHLGSGLRTFLTAASMSHRDLFSEDPAVVQESKASIIAPTASDFGLPAFDSHMPLPDHAFSPLGSQASHGIDCSGHNTVHHQDSNQHHYGTQAYYKAQSQHDIQPSYNTQPQHDRQVFGLPPQSPIFNTPRVLQSHSSVNEQGAVRIKPEPQTDSWATTQQTSIQSSEVI